jgi:hypothetical protein
VQGLTVQGFSAERLTPLPNQNITVCDEVGETIARRNLARRLTESRIAIAMVGLGLPPAALTVRGHVRATITFAGLARVAANTPPTVESSSTPTAALHFDTCSLKYGGSKCTCDAEVELGPHELEVEL